jgi:hypothetical protein
VNIHIYSKKYYFRNADFILVHIKRKNRTVLEHETALARINKLIPRSEAWPRNWYSPRWKDILLLFIKSKGSSPYSQERYPYPEKCESTLYSLLFNMWHVYSLPGNVSINHPELHAYSNRTTWLCNRFLSNSLVNTFPRRQWHHTTGNRDHVTFFL